jgi:hypothetical protein
MPVMPSLTTLVNITRTFADAIERERVENTRLCIALELIAKMNGGNVELARSIAQDALDHHIKAHSESPAPESDEPGR